MKALLFTQDSEVDITIFVLRAIQKLLPTNGIQFVVPFADREVARTIKQAVPGLDIGTHEMPASAPGTLRRLVEMAGNDNWVLWQNSDRLPIAYNRKLDFGRLADAIENGEADRYAAVKLMVWRELEGLEKPTRTIAMAGAEFAEVPYSRFGFWHPHFIRTEVLGDAVERLSVPGGFRRANIVMADHLASLELPTLLPTTPILKCEETLLNGKVTLNLESRRRRCGLKPMAPGQLVSKTASFTSPQTLPKVNTYWLNSPRKVEQSLSHLSPELKCYFVSPGGVGSKVLCQSFCAACGVQDRVTIDRSHGHRRLPWPSLLEHQCAVYVFGDPCNAVLSFFSRRIQRHARHGMTWSHAETPEETKPGDSDWVIRHMSNLQVPPGPLNETWGLREFLSQPHDLFRLEEHLDSWLYADAPYPVVFLRYETLWENAGAVARYFGLADLSLPDQVQRASDWTSLPTEDQKAMTAIFGGFSNRIASLPDVFVADGTTFRTLDGNEDVLLEHI
ncbi:MAG: hypothetical protein AAF358_10355 [Pseudomonadota bacterium]